jgi:hypothetical protein
VWIRKVYHRRINSNVFSVVSCLNNLSVTNVPSSSSSSSVRIRIRPPGLIPSHGSYSFQVSCLLCSMGVEQQCPMLLSVRQAFTLYCVKYLVRRLIISFKTRTSCIHSGCSEGDLMTALLLGYCSVQLVHVSVTITALFDLTAAVLYFAAGFTPGSP